MIKKIEEEIVQKKFVNETEKLIVNVLFTASWLNRVHAFFFKNFNITNEQYNVLRILRGQYPNVCSVALITERMIEKSSNTSRILDRLILKKMAIRSVSLKDKRLVDVSITPFGLELLAMIDTKIIHEQNKFNILSHQEMVEMNDLLDKFRSINT